MYPKTDKLIITDRQAEILRNCYDFDNYKFPTLDEVAYKYNLSRERIRQIKDRTLYKLFRACRTIEADIPCTRFYKKIIHAVEETEGINEYLKLINFVDKNFTGLPIPKIAKLFSSIIFTYQDNFSTSL